MWLWVTWVFVCEADGHVRKFMSGRQCQWGIRIQDVFEGPLNAGIAPPSCIAVGCNKVAVGVFKSGQVHVWTSEPAVTQVGVSSSKFKFKGSKVPSSKFQVPRFKVQRFGSTTFTAHMESLLADDTMADAVFHVDGAVLTAHRALLCARSEYLNTMLRSGFEEQQSGHITIEDASAAEFRVMLRYLYTDQLDLPSCSTSVADNQLLLGVLRLSHRMCLDDMHQRTLAVCKGTLRSETAIWWLSQADQHGLADMRAQAVTYVAQSFSTIRRTAAETLKQLHTTLRIVTRVHSLRRASGHKGSKLLAMAVALIRASSNLTIRKLDFD